MDKNQFYYTRKEGEKEMTDSFNVNKVIRTLTIEDGRTLVLLDDLHERVVEVPVYNPSTGKLKEMRRERNTYQSELYLDEEDAKRLKDLTSI
jgi:hypothetical protein